MDPSSEINEGTFASTFRSRNTAMSAEDLRKARESRAAEALKMKDEQINMLTMQNASLLDALNKVLHTLYYTRL